MVQFVQRVKRQVAGARRAERFVRLLVGGGLALVLGLWLATLAEPVSAPWLLGVGLVLGGVGGLAAGIGSQVEW